MGLLALLVLCLGAAGLFAADAGVEAPLFVASPEVLAQGGSFVANAQGFNGLLYNPASFALPGGSFTALSTTAWMYADPSRAFELVRGGAGPESLLSFAAQEVTAGGFGGGFATGIGYVGRGVGLGALLTVDSYLWGSTAFGAEGDLSATLAFVAGWSFPIQLWGLKLYAGADLRPMIRVRAPMDYTAMIGMLDALQGGGNPLAALSSVDTLYGYAFAIDMGAIAELGDLRLGLAVRDFLGTRFAYNLSSFDTFLDSLRETGTFPTTGAAVTGYSIPMRIDAGASYHLDLGPLNALLDPVVHASVDDLLGLLEGGSSLWPLLHLGTEVGVLHFLKVRAGLDQGYFTLGAGLKLLFLDLNLALFTREMGLYSGDRPSSGMTVEVALRF
jgi:hypothetical protein